MIQLTAPNGHPIYVRPEAIDRIEPPLSGAHGSLITIAGREYMVQEEPATIRARVPK